MADASTARSIGAGRRAPAEPGGTAQGRQFRHSGPRGFVPSQAVRLLVLLASAVLVAACSSGTTSSAPGPRTTPTTAGTASTTSTSTTAAPGTGLADASLGDLSWVSATEGWALATRPCGPAICTVIAHTTDGGRHWQRLPADAPAQLGTTVDCSHAPCVTNLRFASRSVGYLYGPALYMTTDGGLSWHLQPGPSVEALSAAAGHVYRVAYDHTGCPGPCDPLLQDAEAGATTWHSLISHLDYPGRSGSAQIVASGSSLLVAMYGSQAGPVPAEATLYRSTDAGLSWQQRADPCSGQGPGGPNQEQDLIDLANAPGGFFAGLCSPHTGSGVFVMSSTDYGASWHVAGTLPAGTDLSILAAASPTVLAVATGQMAGTGSLTAQLVISTDGGQHWSTAATDNQQTGQASAPAWLGFETSTVGRWIGDPHGIWTTGDGGRHWVRLPFG